VEVERRRTESVVLSVRLPRHVFRELILAARREGKGPATLARELIEEGLARHERARKACPG
jgi:predicted DNA-binding protein